MKVAIISQPWEHMAHPHLGSVEIQIDGASRHLVATGQCDVTIYTRRTRGFPAREFRRGVEYRRFGIMGGHRLIEPLESVLYPDPKKPFFASVFYYLSFYLQVAADLRRQNPDVVHIHDFAQFLPLARRACPNAALVIHMHCDWLSSLASETVRDRLKHADAIVGCSHFIADRIRNRFPECASRCFTIYNGVETGGFPAISESTEDGPLPAERRLLYVGRISPDKGIHILLDAFAKVLEQAPEAMLHLVGSDAYPGRRMCVDHSDDPIQLALAAFGDTGYRETMERRMKSAVAQRVRFHGPLPHGNLIGIYRKAEMVIVPSPTQEAFGLPAAEAAACGLPVIAARSGGLPEIVQDGVTGYVVDRADSDQLAGAVLKLLRDDSARASMGIEGRKRVLKLFSWEVSTQTHLRLYHTLQSERGKAQFQRLGLERQAL